MTKRIAKILFLFLFLLIFTLTQAQKLAWAKSYKPSAGYVVPIDMYRYKGFIYTVGHFTGTVDFDPGAGTASRTNNGSGLNFNIYVTKLDTNGNFYWVQTFGSTNGDTRVAQTTVDSKGNVYTCGRFIGDCDFDPGTGTFSVSTTRELYFIQKLNPAGSFVWAKSFGYSEQNESFHQIAIDPFGNIITIGSFNDSIDLDPSSAKVVFKRKNNDNPDAFLQKLDSNGNYINGFAIEPHYLNSMAFDQQGIYLAGSYYGKQDVKPGPDTLYFSTFYASNSFVMKIDHNLNFVWAKSLGTEGGAGNIFLDNNGKLFIAGGFTKTADFDPGSGQAILTYGGVNYNPDYFYLKMDTSGNFISALSHSFGNGSPYVYKTCLDAQNNYYMSGYFSGTIDCDPSAAVYNLKSNSKKIGFISKIDQDGNFLWAHAVGDTTSNNDVLISTICTDQNLNVYAGIGFNVPIDCDPDTSKFKLIPITSLVYDGAYFKWKQSACNSMAISVDTMKSSGCNIAGRMRVKGLYGKSPYTYEWNTSPVNYTAAIGYSNKGTYTVTVRDKDRCLKQATYLGFGPDIGSGFDLQAHLVSGEFRPGFKSNIKLDAYNALCTQVSGELKLVLNNLLRYDSAKPAPTARRGDTLVWAFSNLDYNAQHLKPEIFVTVSSSAKINDMSCLDLLITPTKNDVNASNNIKTYCKKIVNGYDPNDKTVYPPGACNEHYILKTDDLEYCIRFQNTGNSIAVNIVIEDSIDNNLDLSTLKVLAKSHDKLTTEVLKGNLIRFTFNTILLPDSGSDFRKSQGYIIFKLKQKPNLNNGIRIKNTSFIYFDYNPAVITNTTFNTIIGSIPIENTSTNKTSCDSLNFNDHTFKKSGSFTTRFFGSDGCDSIVKLNVTIKKSSLKSQTTLACDSFIWDNVIYKTSGIYKNIIVNYAGCDSIRVLNLSINKSNSFVMNRKTCDSFILNAQVYKSSGTYVQNLSNYKGCDSVLHLNLDIINSSSHNIATSACGSYTLNSVVYTKSGNYIQNTTNAAGCDSIIHLDLVLNSPNGNEIKASACKLYILKNKVYRKSGLYSVATETNYLGCDSVITLNLKIDTVNTAVSQNKEVLTATAAGAAYQWLNCSSMEAISTANNQSYTAIANGDYAVEVSQNNCKDTSECYTVSTLGILSEQEASINIQPNPSNGIVTINFHEIAIHSEICLRDITGRLISCQMANDVQNIVLELGTEPGVYFISIRNANGIFVYKLVRE